MGYRRLTASERSARDFLVLTAASQPCGVTSAAVAAGIGLSINDASSLLCSFADRLGFLRREKVNGRKNVYWITPRGTEYLKNRCAPLKKEGGMKYKRSEVGRTGEAIARMWTPSRAGFARKIRH